ncbi:hypothetical protein FHX48_000093 [Microbacterium halimionae]|uniref:PE domain-containing protein n=1 Tax=Microbacterium halimionae TaxID=1526413 RepID=A0A7W3JLL4_9MICO|nr:hypothetical protein [Microbacterium halimionae]MBA8815041.1 hypothetical protein [Microbacterium halimionae]NII94168.1 hypothetical protein [Microbacterium halimionae]
MSDVVVNIDVITDDAENMWEDASERLIDAKGALPEIATPDFSSAFDAAALSAAYNGAVKALSAYLDGGSTEFLKFEKNLLEAAIVYGEAHGMTDAEIAALEGEIDV